MSNGISRPAWQNQADIDYMLDQAETWAVVGLSGDPSRTAFRIAELLQDNGKRIVPVNPRGADVLGEKGYPSLTEIPFHVDVVDVFRRSDQAGQHADEAVAIGADAVWFQLGVVDEDAYRRTVDAGLRMVMDTCPAIEWNRRR